MSTDIDLVYCSSIDTAQGVSKRAVTCGSQMRSVYLKIPHEVWCKAVRYLTPFCRVFTPVMLFFFAASIFYVCLPSFFYYLCF
jgi:hypothetical protein